jgi:hypothetical protein
MLPPSSFTLFQWVLPVGMQLEGIHMLSLDLSPLDDIACDWTIIDELNTFINPKAKAPEVLKKK